MQEVIMKKARQDQMNNVSGHFAIFATGILLGFIPLFKSELINDFSSTWIVVFRICAAFLMVALLLLGKFIFFGYRKKILISTWRDLFGFMIYGIICITAVNYLYIKSLTLTTATIAVVIVFTMLPLTTILVNALVNKERATPQELMYIGMITFGCFLVTAQVSEVVGYAGIFYAAAAGFCYGLYSVVGTKISVKYDYPVMMLWQFGIATISSLALLFIFERHSPIFSRDIFFDLVIKNVWMIFAIGFFATFLPYILYSYGIKKGVKAARASALTMAEPASATIVSCVLLHEQISMVQIVGVIIVLFFSIRLSCK